MREPGLDSLDEGDRGLSLIFPKFSLCIVCGEGEFYLKFFIEII